MSSLRSCLVLPGAALVVLLPACFNPPSTALAEDGSSTGGASTSVGVSTTSGSSGSGSGSSSDAGGSSSTGPSVVDEGSTSSTSLATDSGSSESTTGPACGEGEISCEGECIDPLIEDRYCGAVGDCQGDNAGSLCVLSSVCSAGACQETCDDCGFESGTLAAWVTVDLTMPYIALAVQSAGVSPGGAQFAAEPTEGMYVAMNGFDGNGGDGTGSTIEIGQDISLSSASASMLVLDHRASWNNSGMLARTFEVLIEPAGGGAPFESVLLLSADGGTNSMIPSTTEQIDLSAYAGETVFVNFVWTVPETFTGPATAQLDHVRFEEMP